MNIVISELESNRSYAFVSDVLDIPRTEIKNIVYMHLPHFDNNRIIEINFEEIKELFVNEVPICIIANRYGIQQSKLCKYIIEKLPEYAVERQELIKFDKDTNTVWMFSGMTWYKVNN